MIDTIKRYPLFFITSGVVISIILVILFLINRPDSKGFTLEQTTPGSNENRVAVHSTIELSFNRLPPTTPQFTFSPEVKGSLTRNENDKEFVFIPDSPLLPRTTYIVSISLPNTRFQNPRGQSGNTYTWNFHTDQEQYGEEFIERNPTAMQQFQQNMREAENAFTDRKKRLPFIMDLPYETTQYRVEISAISDTVTISTFGNTREEHLRYREEALNWIRSNGGNTANFTTRFVPANL